MSRSSIQDCCLPVMPTRREVRRQLLAPGGKPAKSISSAAVSTASAPPFQKVNPHPFLAANRLIPSSYVSLQSALAYYGMIPEHVPVTTSVTTSRPAHWETPLGVFDFRHIQVNFFYGYRLADLGEKQQAFIASPEKALLDLVYLELGGDTLDYLASRDWSGLDRLRIGSSLVALRGRLKNPNFCGLSRRSGSWRAKEKV